MKRPSVSRLGWMAGGMVVLLGAAVAGGTVASAAGIQCLAAEGQAGASEAVVVEGCALAHTTQLLPVDKEGRLIGEGSVDAQLAQALFNLETALAAAGSSCEQLVKVNGYCDSVKTAASVQKTLGRRFSGPVRPAVSLVVTRLPHPGARVALDAVGVVDRDPPREVVRRPCAALAGDPAAAQVAVLPSGDAVYVSGQAESGELLAATGKTMASLMRTLAELRLDRGAVVQVKAFLQPMEQAEAVKKQIAEAFAGQAAPPIALVEWSGSAAIEIELIASAPRGATPPADTVSYITPPGMKASPVYSRVARTHGGKTIYLAGLYASQPGSAEAQIRDIFGSLQRVLNRSGSDMGHLVKATYYCGDEDSGTMLNKLRPEFYDPKRPPAASKARVAGVGTAARSVAIDMIAVTAP